MTAHVNAKKHHQIPAVRLRQRRFAPRRQTAARRKRRRHHPWRTQASAPAPRRTATLRMMSSDEHQPLRLGLRWNSVRPRPERRRRLGHLVDGLEFGGAVKAPRIRSKNLTASSSEATAVRGVILAILSSPKSGTGSRARRGVSRGWNYNQWYFAGYSLFASGLGVGLTNVASGVSVASRGPRVP